jgi:hypothetical protein
MSIRRLSTFDSTGEELLLDDAAGTIKRGSTQIMAASSVVPGGADTQVQFNDGGAIAGNAGLTFNKATGALSATSLVGPLTGNADTATLAKGEQDTATAAAADGAIAVKTGLVAVTKAGVAALTLAAPTATTDDGKVLTVISTTANAHTITTPAGKLNGLHIATFGGAIGDSVTLVAYQGVWYTRATRNVVIS